MQSEFKSAVQRVVDARQQAEQYDLAVGELRDAWERENAGILEGQSVARQQKLEAEDNLRYLTIQAYLASDCTDKKPYEGVGIRDPEGGEPEYSTEEAIAWCIEHGHTELLAIRASAFRTVAKALKPPFVTFVHTPVATISQTLGASSTRENDPVEEPLPF